MQEPFVKKTHGMTVKVVPSFMREHSSISKSLYTWRYDVRIESEREDSVQLMNRYWKIINANGEVQEVFGPGVVGQQPIIHPAGFFEYSSFTQFNTPSGEMTGYYEMQGLKGEKFDIEIPLFKLYLPVRLVKAGEVASLH